MTYKETCPACSHTFGGEFPDWFEPDVPVYRFCCPSCMRYFEVENNPKIVWKLDAFSKTWYTTLVHKYTKLGETMKAFDYYD